MHLGGRGAEILETTRGIMDAVGNDERRGIARLRRMETGMHTLKAQRFVWEVMRERGLLTEFYEVPE